VLTGVLVGAAAGSRTPELTAVTVRTCTHPCHPQTAARPDDVEAWRLLGESRLLSAEPAKSVAAYERAFSLAAADQSVITVGT
jgi:hypothetical protein